MDVHVRIPSYALNPGAPAEAVLEAISTLSRGGVLVDIGGMMERPALDLFAMMCAQRRIRLSQSAR